MKCIVIGYNDVSFTEMLEEIKPYKDISAAHDHFMAQSVVLEGKRFKYNDLINKCISHSSGEESDLHIFKMPSLGVHYLTCLLNEHNLEAYPVNFYNFEKEIIKKHLLENPDLIVVISTVYYYDAGPIKEIIEFVRGHNPNAKIILGGTYICSNCVERDERELFWLFDQIQGDFYINDLQGEQTLVRLCKDIISKAAGYSDIPNLIYKEDGEYIRTNRIKERNDLEQIPIRYMSLGKHKHVPAMFVRSSRSCPNSCSFCRYPLLGGEHVLSDLKFVENELDYLKSIGTEYLVFVDDSLNIPLDRFKKLCRLMIEKKYNFKWFSYFRCSDADDETFNLMKESGCKGVFLGIESGDPEILILMNKNAEIESYKNGIQKLHERGIYTLASFMIGFPGETDKSVKNTINFIKETKPTFYTLQVYFHETKVPISLRKDEFDMKGSGYNWSHKTMDWQTASKYVAEGYQSITDSIIMPFYSFNLWALGYYLSQGFPEEKIMNFLKLSTKMLAEGLRHENPQYEEWETELLNSFK